MGAEVRRKTGKYEYGNYYEFFPALNGEGDETYDSGIQIPRAEGFPATKGVKK